MEPVYLQCVFIHFDVYCELDEKQNEWNEWNDVCCFGGADEISNWKNGNCITLSVKRLFVCSKWKSVAPLTGAVITTDNDDDQWSWCLVHTKHLHTISVLVNNARSSNSFVGNKQTKRNIAVTTHTRNHLLPKRKKTQTNRWTNDRHSVRWLDHRFFYVWHDNRSMQNE